MRKTTIITILALFAISTSCKKDYTCECTTKTEMTGIFTLFDEELNGAEALIPSEIESSTTITDRKKKAEEECENKTGETSIMGMKTSVECQLK